MIHRYDERNIRVDVIKLYRNKSGLREEKKRVKRAREKIQHCKPQIGIFNENLPTISMQTKCKAEIERKTLWKMKTMFCNLKSFFSLVPTTFLTLLQSFRDRKVVAL